MLFTANLATTSLVHTSVLATITSTHRPTRHNHFLTIRKARQHCQAFPSTHETLPARRQPVFFCQQIAQLYTENRISRYYYTETAMETTSKMLKSHGPKIRVWHHTGTVKQYSSKTNNFRAFHKNESSSVK